MPSPPEQHLINFPFIYENCGWGNNHESGYRGSSGEGSKLEHCMPYVCFLRGWIFGSDIDSVCDVGCGDLRHFFPLYNGTKVQYTGYDIYKPLIESHNSVPEYQNPKWTFEYKHCYSDRDTMVGADLLIIKDVLQHWTDEEVKSFMDWATSCGKYKYILITNCTGDPAGRLDTPGRWRGLDKNHHLLESYNLLSIFQYSTKRCLLWRCV